MCAEAPGESDGRARRVGGAQATWHRREAWEDGTASDRGSLRPGQATPLASLRSERQEKGRRGRRRTGDESIVAVELKLGTSRRHPR